MASIVTNLTCELTAPVSVVFLPGNMFSMDNGGNIINVFVVQNGEPVALGGSVSANVIRSDGTTVAITGAFEGNKAYIILPQACYAVPGIIHIVMKITEGTTITTIAAVTANVYQSSTDAVVDPGTLVPSIAALIEAIEDAVDSIPVDYSGLLATLAADYSTSKTYKVGDYAWYGGVLKRCIVPITTAESYTAAHWTNAVLGDDVTNLKSAFDSVTSKTRNLWEYGDISGTQSANKAFNFESGVKYTISCKITSNYPGSSAYTRVSLTNNNVQEKVYGLITHDGTRHSCTVTATEDCTKIYFYAANTSTNSAGYDVSVSEIQIEKGESATSYVNPLTAVDEIVRADLDEFETGMEQSNKQNLAKKTLADGKSLFANIDGFNYWGGWAYSSWFTENLLQNSNLTALAHFLSFGSGDYTRGVIGVQRNPLKLGVFSKVDGSSDLWAGTAKLTPWKKSIAFFGDSIMWGRDGDEGTVTQVERSIPVYCGMNLGCRAVNKGVGSQGWIAEGGGRNALEELQAYSSLSTEDIIVLCWGVNDLHDYNVGDWENPESDTIMYQVGLCVDYIYSVNPTATVVIVAPWNSPSYGSAPKYKYGTTKWQTMEAAEKNYCDYWGIPFISQADSPLNGKNMMAFFSTVTTDRVHPTKKGYEKLGNWLAAKLSALI